MTTYSPAVLATRVLPRHLAVMVIAIVGFALLTAAAAQFVIPLPFTPVPITGQTFAVLLSGAVLGSRAGATSMGLYLLLGAVGLPFYADGGSGWSVVTGATGGYLVGFIAAAYVVGLLAERRQDRTPWSAVPAFLAGSVVIYLIGVPWLAVVAEMDTATALERGLAPFVIGDLAKALVAGLALPVAWRLVRD